MPRCALCKGYLSSAWQHCGGCAPDTALHAGCAQAPAAGTKCRGSLAAAAPCRSLQRSLSAQQHQQHSAVPVSAMAALLGTSQEALERTGIWQMCTSVSDLAPLRVFTFIIWLHCASLASALLVVVMVGLVWLSLALIILQGCLSAWRQPQYSAGAAGPQFWSAVSSAWSMRRQRTWRPSRRPNRLRRSGWPCSRLTGEPGRASLGMCRRAAAPEESLVQVCDQH